jgi:hypothetical protein
VQALGAPAEVKWTGFTARNVSSSGEAFFQASLSGPSIDPDRDYGFWVGAPSSIHLLAVRGAPAWDMPSDIHFGSVGVNVNFVGTKAMAVVSGSLTGPGINSGNDSAIWSGTPGNLKLVAREGDQAPGLPAGIVFGDLIGRDISAPLNSLGEIALGVPLAGLGVNADNAGSLWATDANGNLVLIARYGDLFDVGGGDLRTIKGLQLIKKYQQIYGEVGAAPDEFGRISFEAEFTDGSSGIFFATVPEPGGLMWLAAGAIKLGRWRLAARIA